jgi:hypothetical protein
MIRNEPVLTGVTALLAAAAGLLVAFGVHLTDVQIAALVEFVQAAYAVALLVRRAVTPTAKQRASAPPPTPPPGPPPAAYSPPVAG